MGVSSTGGSWRCTKWRMHRPPLSGVSFCTCATGCAACWTLPEDDLLSQQSFWNVHALDGGRITFDPSTRMRPSSNACSTYSFDSSGNSWHEGEDKCEHISCGVTHVTHSAHAGDQQCANPADDIDDVAADMPQFHVEPKIKEVGSDL
jgi:hypothetical protein